MTATAPIRPDIAAFLAAERPQAPVFLLCPAAVTAAARRFLGGFPGLVTFAVKANPEPAVLLGLIAAGVRGFDAASPAEIRLVRRLCPDAAIHYHNPVKSRAELAEARALGVRAYAVDCRAELRKIADVLPAAGTELSIRFRLPVKGGAYDFGAKFGADEGAAAELAREAAALGFATSLTFHPGTQCEDPAAYAAYIAAAARIAAAAGVRLERLNVGGGFPAARAGARTPTLAPFFETIDRAATRAFGADRPALVCEPGRAMVADAMALVTQVKLVRDDGAAFLDDGIYGGLAEAALLGPTRARAFTADGAARTGAPRARVVFGPTCDSVDRLPGEPVLPGDIAEGDHVVFLGLGAYGTATVTRFNGYGPQRVELVGSLAG